ncbi:MAG: A/G-specific adenine glycosylase [Syntrophobacteraceae bacterium]|jgi:A/G-specific adenine glycosylase|nr:A/G-specific adenine glycosylase [Syntrophobacteraceae bacterium]
MDIPSPETKSAIQRKLLSWFDTSQRDLPWRKGYRPYQVWISEIMLQQTQVRTVLPYYQRWMERFPDIPSVAEAPEDVVLKHWEGLGYYGRARNIQRTARILVGEYQGEIPGDYQALRRLPGIGPYTAAAILSLAHGQDYPVVDGNVKRVFARLFDIPWPLSEGRSLRIIEETAASLLPHGRAGAFNQALMELGALVCAPRSPRCPQCPISGECRSHGTGIVSQRPVPSPRKATTPLRVAVGVLGSRGRIFIQKRPPGGLMPLLWEFPGGKVREGETPEEALVRELWEELEVRVGILGKIGALRHAYTSFRVELHAFHCRLLDDKARPVLRSAVEARWVMPHELTDFPFPAANGKLIRSILAHPR